MNFSASATSRIQILDSIRGIAVLGILLINIPFFGFSYLTAENITLNNEQGINYYTWWVMNLGFEGTMRGLFSLLFGASSILLIQKLDERKKIQSPAGIYYRRLFWLLIFGLFNAYILLWAGDILYTYAIAGIFIFPLRKLKPLKLLILGIIILLVSDMISSLYLYYLKYNRINGEKALAIESSTGRLNTDEELAKKDWLKYWNENNPDSMRKEVAHENETMRKDYFSVMKHVAAANAEVQTAYFVSFGFWDALGFFLIGMAFMKWKILIGERSRPFYWTMLILGYSIGFSLGVFLLNSALAVRFDESLLIGQRGWDFYQVRRFFMVIGHLGLVILLYKYGLFKSTYNALAKVGQMAFTNYLMQTIFCILIFHGYGLGLFGRLERYQLYLIMVAIWIFQIIFSNYWMRHHRYGPLEWLWRRLIYLRSPLSFRARRNIGSSD